MNDRGVGVGRGLGVRTRDRFERLFGADLGSVRIHQGPAAASAAHALGADAFTIGNNVFFAAGRYEPHTRAGRRLLAHELTHVLQQRGALGGAADESLCETEASEAAAAIERGASWKCSVPDRFGQLRRAASIGSATVHVRTSSHVKTPTVSAGEVSFESTRILAHGSATLIGRSPALGWTLGFLQVEWVDTNWLYYRGQNNTDGSTFFQRSRPPVRPVVACRDVDPGTDTFYTDAGDLAKVGATDLFPLTLRVDHSDQPEDSCDAVVTNSKTGKPNFLHEAQLEFLFCTVLSAQDPAGNFHHLKHFYWNVRWQAQFQPGSFANPNGPWTVTPIPGGQGNHVSPVMNGGPNDHRFRRILDRPERAGLQCPIDVLRPHSGWKSLPA